MATAAQVAASRLNGALSHGPTSEEGKAISSRNALKTGLTGRTVLLPSEDAALYEAHLTRFRKLYQPVGDQELALVQSLADTHWRLDRIPSLEMGIYALGRLEFAELFPDQEEGVRKQLIEAKIYLTYQRQLTNLSIQEARLRRQADKDRAALWNLQQFRAQKIRSARLDQAAKAYIEAVHRQEHEQFEPEPLGFEFTLEQIEVRALELEPDLFAEWAAAQISGEQSAADPACSSSLARNTPRYSS